MCKSKTLLLDEVKNKTFNLFFSDSSVCFCVIFMKPRTGGSQEKRYFYRLIENTKKRGTKSDIKRGF